MQRESPGTTPVVQVGGIMTPPEVTKFTAVPSGTGLPWRSAKDIVTLVSVPSVLKPSIASASIDKLARAWAGRPEAMASTAESVCTAGLLTNAALTITLVGTVPENTGTDTLPLPSVVDTTAAVLPMEPMNALGKPPLSVLRVRRTS